jgi:adenine-specific DNA methylase
MKTKLLKLLLKQKLNDADECLSRDGESAEYYAHWDGEKTAYYNVLRAVFLYDGEMEKLNAFIEVKP